MLTCLVIEVIEENEKLLNARARKGMDNEVLSLYSTYVIFRMTMYL